MLKHAIVSANVRRMHSAAECVFIALGSNIGDRATTVHRALDDIASYAEVVDTSFLYETAAYVIS